MEKELQQLLDEIKIAEEKLSVLKEEATGFTLSNNHNDGLSNNFQLSEEIKNYVVKLEEKDKLIQKTEEFSKVGRWSYSFEKEKMKWSPEASKIFEYDESSGIDILDFYKSISDDKATARIPIQRDFLSKSRKDRVMNQTIITTSGNVKLLSFSSSAILNESNEVIGVEGFVKDLSESITGNRGLDNFFKLSSDLHCIVHMNKYFVKVSPAWTKLLGYSEKELLSRSFLDFIHPDDLNKSEVTIKAFDEQGLTAAFENRYITKFGEVVYLSWNSQMDEETRLAYCTVRDVTKSKIEYAELITNLSEKELLLKEIHHRVKNNLQIISSLLSLQAGSNSEEEHLVSLYQDSQNRIQSMAAIHEMFYQSDELDKIEFGEYMEKLIGDLSNTFASKDNFIDFSMEVESVYVNLDTAIPLGLIINELVTNSIKHGADKKGNVNIFIKIKSIQEGKLQLTIGDTGVNSSENVLENTSEGLGVLLINSLVEQIDGEIKQVKDCGGTTFQLVFSDSLNIKS